MNEVYVSGKIMKLQRCPVPLETDRFKLILQVTHRLPTNQITIDNFVVYTWNNAAKWAALNLHPGDQVLVKGSLIHMKSDDMRSIVISALRVIVTQRNTQQALFNE